LVQPLDTARQFSKRLAADAGLRIPHPVPGIRSPLQGMRHPLQRTSYPRVRIPYPLRRIRNARQGMADQRLRIVR
jgi:hypothetical protein